MKCFTEIGMKLRGSKLRIWISNIDMGGGGIGPIARTFGRGIRTNVRKTGLL